MSEPDVYSGGAGLSRVEGSRDTVIMFRSHMDGILAQAILSHGHTYIHTSVLLKSAMSTQALLVLRLPDGTQLFVNNVDVANSVIDKLLSKMATHDVALVKKDTGDSAATRERHPQPAPEETLQTSPRLKKPKMGSATKKFMASNSTGTAKASSARSTQPKPPTRRLVAVCETCEQDLSMSTGDWHHRADSLSDLCSVHWGMCSDDVKAKYHKVVCPQDLGAECHGYEYDG
jgi:hypothetical protein